MTEATQPAASQPSPPPIPPTASGQVPPPGQPGFPPPGGHGPDGHGPDGHWGGPIADAATALGLDPSQVFTALEQGQSLEDLAATKGISKDQLIAAMKAAMPAGMPLPPDADAMLADLVSHKGLPQGGPGGPGGGRRPDGPPPGAPGSLRP